MNLTLVVHVARREWLEQRRQVPMLVSMGLLYGVIASTVILGLLALESANGNPEAIAILQEALPDLAVGGDLSPLGVTALQSGHWLMFTQLLGMTGVFAGQALLQERELHTLPFLLLTPLKRSELLFGKILGAAGYPLVIYVTACLAIGFVGSLLPLTSAAHSYLPPSLSWGVTFLISGPAWALFVATLGAWISFYARDVRTAQQLIWFVLFFVSLACGTLLTGQLPHGAGNAAGVAVFGIACLAIAFFTTVQAMSKDLGR